MSTPCTVCRTTVTSPSFVVNGWQVVDCRRCGHRYVDPPPHLDELTATIYDEDYFANPVFASGRPGTYHGYVDYVADRPCIQARQAEVLDRLEATVAPGRLLDVGCGLGFFVELAARRGWAAHGTELNDHAVRWACERVTPHVVHAPVHELPFGDGAFDVVTMFDVVEHLRDPRRGLAEVRRVLRPGGRLVLVTPDAGSRVARLLGRHWQEIRRAPEHLHFFDLRNLSRLLASTGFAPESWHTMGKVTSVRGVVADLRTYAPALFGMVERLLERIGWSERIVDIDPRSKVCLYARVGQVDGDAQPVRVGSRRPLVRLIDPDELRTHQRAPRSGGSARRRA